MFVLSNPVRDYAWGSTKRLSEFLHRAPSGGPEAELWIGAHEGDPSLLPDGRGLDRGIAEDPVAMLGERVHQDHGARLPFLMKVLAVNEPLSLQVHPDSERARIGFGREQRAGVPLDAPHRSYKDPWHKPELIYALSRFEGMAGFRDVQRTCGILSLLQRPWSDEMCARLSKGNAQQSLRAVVGELLAMDADDVRGLLADLVVAVSDAAVAGHRQEQVSSPRRARAFDEGALVRREAVRVFDQFPALVERYPDDPGVLVTLLLNHVVLAPGEAMFVGAGVVHAYVAGFGVEIMAASDNVVRAGLTPKYRDVLRADDRHRLHPHPGAPLGSRDGGYPGGGALRATRLRLRPHHRPGRRDPTALRRPRPRPRPRGRLHRGVGDGRHPTPEGIERVRRFLVTGPDHPGRSRRRGGRHRQLLTRP